MYLLALDTAGKTAAVAVLRDDVLLYEAQCNNGLTHSETLLPMIADMLRSARLTLDDVDAFAVAAGPGSFTGVRIGVSAVKGLAFGRRKPCVAVSTLEAMAYLPVGGAYVCAAMDARCGQVYNALFRVDGTVVQRLCPDRAIPVDALGAELAAGGQAWTLVGDGAMLCADRLAGVADVRLAPPTVRMQRASAVAVAAELALARGESVSDAALVPLYLRPPQAEREWNARHGG